MVIRYREIDVLGRGADGVVKLVERTSDKKRFALKTQYVDPQDPYLMNELLFHKQVARNHPEFFMTLVHHDFKPKCSESRPAHHPDLDPETAKELDQRMEKKVCIQKVYSLVDGTLEWSTRFKSLCASYSFMIQMLHSIWLMEQKGWVHADLHPKNIGYIRVPKSTKVEIMGQSVPTCGVRYIPVDYDGVLNINTLVPDRPWMGIKGSTEQERYEQHLVLDKTPLILLTVLRDDEQKLDHPIVVQKVLSTQQGRDAEQRVDRNNKDLAVEYVRILHPKIYYELTGNTVLRRTFPKEDYKFFFDHFFNTEMLIQHFLKRIQSCSSC